MKFTKMHGTGNDYIYVNCFEEKIEDPSALSVRVSDRHFGIGSDGLVLIGPSDRADFSMVIYNADGSRAKMCGNGIRCVGKYVYDHGMTHAKEVTVMTDSGIRTLHLYTEGDRVKTVRVEMGVPVFTAAQVPVLRPADAPAEMVEEKLTVAGREWTVTAVSTGNPHCVVLLPEGEDPWDLDLAAIGPSFEKAPIFPEGVNTEFIRVVDRKTLRMHVWERGSGETLACGTGATASAAAMMKTGRIDREADVILRGGTLHFSRDEATGAMFMTGPAETVFEGEI